jgi:hypothetical protein
MRIVSDKICRGNNTHIFRKSLEEIQVSWNSGKKNGYVTWRLISIFDQFFITFWCILLRMRIVSDKICRGNNTHILCSITFFFLKSCRCWDNVEKNIVEPDRSQMTIWRMLDTWGYKHTLRICNTSCYFIVFFFKVHSLSCSLLYNGKL